MSDKVLVTAVTRGGCRVGSSSDASIAIGVCDANDVSNWLQALVDQRDPRLTFADYVRVYKIPHTGRLDVDELHFDTDCYDIPLPR